MIKQMIKNLRNNYAWMLKDTVKHIPTNAGKSRLNITGVLNVQNLALTLCQTVKKSMLS